MHNGYTAFTQSLRAKSPFPYSLIPPSSDQDFHQNPYCNPNQNHRLPLSNGYFSRQSALLYWTPSRTFLAAAATYLATTRRSQVKLSHCTPSTGSTNCCVTVREIRCCHSHCFCDPTRSSFRNESSCNQGRGPKFLEREVTQARQVWRCNGDYECECEHRGRQDLIERDVRRREKLHEPRSANTRMEEYYDYREFDNCRQRDDYSRGFNRGRRDECEHDYEDNEKIRLIDQRGRRKAHDNKFGSSERRRREEYDDYEDNERIRLSDWRRRRDEYDDKIRFSDHQRRRGEYDDYDEVEDVRNRHGRISSSNRMRREEHDLEEVDDYKSRRADHIKFTDRKRNDTYNERDNEIRVSDHRRRDESYDIQREDKVKVSDQSRRDEYYDYDKEDKIRVSDRRRREDYNERDDNVRVSNQRKTDTKYDRAEEEKEMRRDDQIRVSDRRGREVYDQRDDNIRVSDRRRRDEYFEYDNEDKIRVSDRRRRDDCYDYDNEDKIRVSDRRRRHLYYDIDGEDVIRVSDRRKRNEYYDYDHEDKIRVSDRRRRNEDYDYDNEDKIRVSDRRRRNECYDYNNEDKIRVSDRRRRNEYYDYDNEDNVRISDQRRRGVYYDIDSKDEVRVSELRRNELYDARDDNLRVMDKRRRDEYCDYNEDDRIRVSDQRRREENYDCKEEGKIRVFDQRRKEGLSKKDERINISDYRSREEADDYEEVYTNLQLRGNSTKVSGSKLERQSSFKERDEASTSQIGQTEEREGKYRLDREHYDRKSSKEGSQIVKIISEDDCSLVSRERKNAVNHLTASDAQLNMQNKTQVGTQRQRFGSSTSVQSNTLNQLTVSEVEKDVQNRTHISTGINQVGTSSEVQSQVQVTRDKKKIVNQLGASETELNIQNRTIVDIQRKMVGTSSSVQSESQVARDKKNVQHQLMVTEVESDLQNKSKTDDERRRVDASISVQNVMEFTKNGHNVVDQLIVGETESDAKRRMQIESQMKRNDTSTSVQNLTQVVRDKHNVRNRLTWSEVVSNVRTINQIEAERRRVDLDSSVDNVTQVASQRQKVGDQLTVSEVESDVQSQSQTEAEMTIVDTATTVQNVTEVAEEKSNVENQFLLHETEVNVLNKTDVNLARVDASALTDKLSTVTDSGTSTALIQTTGSGSGRVEISSLEAGSHNTTFLKGSLESASQLEKSSSYHVGQFVDSVQEELLGGSGRKGPPDDVWDLKSSDSHGTYQSAASPSTKTENTVTGRHGRSLWAFVADIIKLGLLKGPGRQLKSGRRSSSSDSKGTDDWFSGQEELDLEMKNDNEIKDEEQLLVEHPSEVVPSVLIKSPEVDLLVSDDETVIPSLQEKTVVEVGGHESSSFIGETDNFSKSTTSGVNSSGVVGATLRLGEKIVEEIPKIVRHVAEQSSQIGYGSDLPASIAAGENNTSVTSGGSLLEANISRDKESGKKRESKRGKQLKRTTQVPKSSFDEWEEENSREVETPAVDPIGVSEVLPSGVTGVPVVSTSFGAATLVSPPSGASGHPSASAFSDSSTLHMPTIGDTGIGAAGELKRAKQLTRIAQVKKISADENEETKVGELTAAASDSTTFRTELLESGVVEGHESVNTGSKKHLIRLSQAPRESFEEWEEAYLREKEQRRLDEFYMREALVEAQRASDAWEVPVGAVLVRNGEVIARGCNLVEELRDSTAHAEMVCIREASNLLRSWRLSDTTLYVTLEPCAMCAGAILQARIDTVVWGAPNKLLGADGSWVRLFPGDAGTSSSLEPPEPEMGPVHPFHPKITIRRGILEDECSEIMQQFFKLRRKKKITKPETSTNPSCLPAHPLKFFSRFGGMFCM